MNNKLYFSATTSTTGYELFVSDGTTVTLVKDISSGTPSGTPIWLTAAGDHIVFYAADGTNGFDIWTSDGTTDGTLRIFDNRKQLSNAVNANPMFQVAGSNLYFFTWAESDYGPSLWKF
jgi:ELWxxDGT repeat protein